MNGKRNLVFGWMIVLAIIALVWAGGAIGAVEVGQSAPEFSLKDINGKNYALKDIKGRQMTVLYFFDARSDASQGGLLILDRLLRKYNDTQLAVWGITTSKADVVRQFNKKAKLQFPILLDSQSVSKTYGAGIVLPVVCTVGPGVEVLDYFMGGGETIEVMLTRLAERQIRRNQTQLAKAMAATVVEKNPGNAEAKAVEGYAALAEGKMAEARQVFDAIASEKGGNAVVGKEGQAAVLAREGQTAKALALAEEVTRKAPKRSIAHKIKGDLLISKGDRKAALAAYQAAAEKSEATPYHKAEAYNQLGRMYAQQGSYSEARSLFDQAIALDPYYIEPTSNKGVSYEKEGMWGKALAEYRQVLALNREDTVASVLARKAEQMLALQKDVAQKERMDRLVKDLVARYKSGKTASGGDEDDWTSRPLVLSFVDIQEKGGLAARDGLAIVMATRLGELLNASGRLQVVERAVMERLLSELNLGSSELADPETALKLGKLLAAKLIGTGSLLYLPGSTVLNMRLIDTETSGIAKTITRRMTDTTDLEKELFNLNRTILVSVMEKYPLQGFIVQTDKKEVMINLGSRQGVTKGSVFAAIEAGKDITYKGRVMRGADQTVGKLEVVRVEPDYSYARVVEKERALARDDKIKEVIPEVVLKGGHDGK